MIQITDTIVLDDREIKERFVRATGPGGQNINKVATAVELRSASTSPVKERLISKKQQQGAVKRSVKVPLEHPEQ
jgi:Protein chain release factor B